MCYTIEEGKKFVPADSDCFQYMGRIDYEDPKRPVLIFPATKIETVFTGTSVGMVLKNIEIQWFCYFGAIIDGVQQVIELKNGSGDELYMLAEGPEDKEHTLVLFKRMAAAYYAEFAGIVVDEGATLRNPEHKYDYKLEVYGDSVSAGEVTEALYYEGQCDPGHHSQYDNSYFAYPSILARKLNAELHDIAQGGIALLDDTGYFCAENLKGMVSCYDKMQYSPQKPTKQWDFTRYTPDCVIIAIGQNDSAPDPEAIKRPDYRRMWKDKYIEMLSDLMEKYPKAEFVLILTALRHDKTWDDAVDEVANEVNSPRVRHFLFSRNGDVTNGHPRATEQTEMAEELYVFLKKNILK